MRMTAKSLYSDDIFDRGFYIGDSLLLVRVSARPVERSMHSGGISLDFSGREIVSATPYRSYMRLVIAEMANEEA